MKRGALRPAARQAQPRSALGVRLSRRAARLEPTPTQAMSQRATALRASGRSVLDFSVGEPDQDTPAAVVAAGKAALDAGRTRYAPTNGLAELREAVSLAYRRDFGVAFEAGEVCVANGGKHALYLVCQALLGPGDEVIVPSPYWPTFPEAVRLAGARPVVVEAREQDGFRVGPQLVRQGLSPRTRAVILNNPSNPTGASISPQDLLAIGRLAKRRGLTVLYDDTYARLRFGAEGASVLQELREMLGPRLAILGTASKSYCMTGWRVGWVLGAKALVDACSSLASHSTQSPATFAQVAAAHALRGPQAWAERLAAEYRLRRDYIHPAVAALPGVTCVRPDGGFYVFPNVERCLSSDVPTSLALAGRLLDEAGVACVPGEGFGRGGYLRLSFARPLEELREGVARLASFFARAGRA